MSLIATPHLEDHDGFYADLLAAHKGLSFEEGHAMNARLIMILANHIGEREVLAEALALARDPEGIDV